MCMGNPTNDRHERERGGNSTDTGDPMCHVCAGVGQRPARCCIRFSIKLIAHPGTLCCLCPRQEQAHSFRVQNLQLAFPSSPCLFASTYNYMRRELIQCDSLSTSSSSFSSSTTTTTTTSNCSCSSVVEAMDDVAITSTRLSRMALAPTHGEDSPYFAGWKVYESNAYDPERNPGGIIQMGLAENQVSLDFTHKWINSHPEASAPASFKETAMFQDYHGLPAFRQALAKFMEQVRGGRVKFDPDKIVLTAGATAANELLTFCLADRGDALLVPTPYYPGFERDLRWRTGVEIVPVVCESHNNFDITEAALSRAYEEAVKQRMKVRGILVTNPSNPLGTTLSAATLRLLLRFARERNMHVISDEIYSGSVFLEASADATAPAPARPFISMAEVAAEHEPDKHRVHVVYSLSKDLGLPGFRVGLLYTQNQKLLQTARRMASFTLVSAHTQRLLALMLGDPAFVRGLLCANRRRLGKRHGVLRRGLARAGAGCLSGGNAGLFAWVDFRRMLPGRDWNAELRLWEILLRQVRLNMTPGGACRCAEPGWFRVCFANMSLPTLRLALRRIRVHFGNNISSAWPVQSLPLPLLALPAVPEEAEDDAVVVDC